MQGRTWGPLNLLLYLSLLKYSHVPVADGARRGLTVQSLNVLLPEWRSQHHVHENYNSTTGAGCDTGNSNPLYTWGALLGYIAMREAL